MITKFAGNCCLRLLRFLIFVCLETFFPVGLPLLCLRGVALCTPGSDRWVSTLSFSGRKPLMLSGLALGLGWTLCHSETLGTVIPSSGQNSQPPQEAQQFIRILGFGLSPFFVGGNRGMRVRSTVPLSLWVELFKGCVFERV